MLLGGAPNQGRQPSRQVRRRLVPPFLRQPGVAADVQEAHRRRAVQSLVQAGPFQRGLDVLDGALAPGVFLLPAVHRQERLAHEGGQPGAEIGLSMQHLCLRHPSFEEWLLDLRAPPVRLRLDDPAEAVRADPEPPLDDEGRKPTGVQELDHGDH